MEAFGHARVLPERIPMQKDSIFDLASVTKVVATATACAVCIDEGLVDLQRPARQYLPDLTGKGAEKITLGQLGSHTSGFDNTKFTSSHQGEAMLQALLAVSPRNEPGLRFKYSCLNFILLGLTVENVTRQPLDVFCEERIFGPLGMRETSFGPVPASPRVVATGRPVGEISDAQARLAEQGNRKRRIVQYGAGSGSFLPNDGRRRTTRRRANSLQGDVVQQITHDSTAARVGRGFGWDLSPQGRPRGLSDATFHHTGWTGQSIWIDPKLKLYVIVLTNRTHPKEIACVVRCKAKRFRIRVAEAVLEVLDEER